MAAPRKPDHELASPRAPSRLRRFDHASSRRHIVLKPDHAAVVEGRTLFPTTVTFVEETGRVLKSGHNSRKIGKEVVVGKWRGKPVYTLTLQERATCPASCLHWRDCYGNHMHMAQRIHHDADFEEILNLELDALASYHRLTGFVVRLHVLGDFYSADYVWLWERALRRLPGLHVFGYTARPVDSIIGAELLRLARQEPRFAIRFSGRPDLGRYGACTTDPGVKHPEAITCPAQTGKTECCGTCGLCWTSDRAIAFEPH